MARERKPRTKAKDDQPGDVSGAGSSTAAEGDRSVPPLRLEWRSPQELAENPANWRRHPESQLAALTDVIAEVGWAGACLFNEKTGRLIDGHGRRTIALRQGAAAVPVLVGSWTEEQERKILATLDPIAGQAETDPAKINELIASIETESEAVRALLDSLKVEEEPEPDGGGGGGGGEPAGEDEVNQKFEILISFATEQDQATWLEKLTKEGLTCRSLLS